VAGAERETEGLAAVFAGIELLAALAAVEQPARVVDGDALAGGGGLPVPTTTSLMIRPLGVVVAGMDAFLYWKAPF
jgi:hypothetical protein